MSATSPNIAPEIPVSGLTAPWWEATVEGRLLLQTCSGCGHRQHHPRHRCLSCGGEELGWSAAVGTGSVDAVTVVHRAPRPDIEVPYVVARVRLTEGPVLLTNLIGADPESWRIGDEVVLQWRVLGDGRRLPVFGRPI
jgi:uncharacterized OB-fold protein